MRYYWCNIVVVERICNDYWHSIRRLFVFYDLPITIFSTIFADNNPHCLKLRDMSLESTELYASLLRHFAGRNRWVKQHLFYNNLLNIRQFFCATFYAIFYATFGMLLLFSTILYHFPIAALVASYAANDTIFAQSFNTFFHCTRGHPKLHGNFSRSNFGI